MAFKLVMLVAMGLAICVMCLPALSLLSRALLALLVMALAAETAFVQKERKQHR